MELVSSETSTAGTGIADLSEIADSVAFVDVGVVIHGDGSVNASIINLSTDPSMLAQIE